MADVSVLVLTYNEELNLPGCLGSVRWSDDVHVVDSGSTDATQEIARRFGARLYLHPFEHFSAQRNWALRHAAFRHDWVLMLDADERTPPELPAEMQRAVVHAPPAVAGFEMRRKVFFQGRWISHAGQFDHFWFLRLFRHGATRYEDRSVNEYPLVEGGVRHLQGALVHENRKPVGEMVAKFRRYAALEAREALKLLRHQADTGLPARWRGTPAERRRWLKHLHLRLPLRGLRKFLYLFAWRLGFLDGIPGIVYCALMGYQEFVLARELRALRRG